MPTDTAISNARDLTLQKIGRNVVNFQRMEAMLKFIQKVANFAAPISKGQEHFETQAKLHRTKPMEHLVDLAAKALHGETPSVPRDTSEVWVTHSISLNDGSQLKEWQRVRARRGRTKRAHPSNARDMEPYFHRKLPFSLRATRRTARTDTTCLRALGVRRESDT